MSISWIYYQTKIRDFPRILALCPSTNPKDFLAHVSFETGGSDPPPKASHPSLSVSSGRGHPSRPVVLGGGRGQAQPPPPLPPQPTLRPPTANQMKISIKTIAGNAHQLDVEDDLQLGALKKKIEDGQPRPPVACPLPPQGCEGRPGPRGWVVVVGPG